MIEEQSIQSWVKESPNGKQRQFREAVHIILSAIANDPMLKVGMVIKGGILLAIRYHSPRYTKDIDFSTSRPLPEVDKALIGERLDSSLIVMAESLNYGLDCRVQSCKIQPAGRPNAQFPSIKMKIGYAYKHDARHKRLKIGKCPITVDIDFSLNERMPNIEELDIGGGETLTAYSLTDLIAEKIRAVLQQTARGRERRQDIYDLFLLIEKFPDLDGEERGAILQSLMIKARARAIEPHPAALADEHIRERSMAHYHTLADEIEGELPHFDEIYPVVQRFYESLPWGQ